MSIGEFAGNFLTAFQNAKNQKSLREQDEKEKKARLSLFEIQLEREKAAQAAGQQQSEAQKQLFERLQTPTQVGPPGNLVAPPGKPPSLTELLADPQGAALLLRSGVLKGDDLLKIEAQRRNQSLLERVLGGSPELAVGGGIGGGVPGGRQGGLELSGLKIGPDGQIMPDFGLPAITTQTVQTPDGPRIQTFDPRTGRRVADLGAGQEQNISPEQAGRIQGLQQGQALVPAIRETFLNPDGSVNRKNVFTSFASIPFSKGRTVNAQLKDAIDGVIRARTGSGMGDGELKSTLEQFQPNPLDSDDTIVDKINRLDRFLSGALDAVTLPPRVRKLLEQESKGKGNTGGASSGRVIDFSDLPE